LTLLVQPEVLAKTMVWSLAKIGKQPTDRSSVRRRHERIGYDRLKRDEIGLNRHRALALCLSMIFSENRFTLFQIML